MDHHGLNLESNNTNFRKHINTGKFNNAHLNHLWVQEEIKKKSKNLLEFNENYHTTYPNLGETAKAVLREKSIELNVYIKKLEKISQ